MIFIHTKRRRGEGENIQSNSLIKIGIESFLCLEQHIKLKKIATLHVNIVKTKKRLQI